MLAYPSAESRMSPTLTPPTRTTPYQQATADLLLEKALLKTQKAALHRKRSALWIEPALETVKALEEATLQQEKRIIPEISELIGKTQLNPLTSRKKVTAGLAQPFDVIAQILAAAPRDFTDNELSTDHRSKTCLGHPFSRSTKVCPGQDLNLHALRHRLLRPTCMPIPPPGRDMIPRPEFQIVDPPTQAGNPSGAQDAVPP